LINSDDNSPAVERYPADPAELDAYGYRLLGEGLYDAAFESFEQLAAMLPDDRRGHLGLAWTAERQWKWQVAAAAWDRCLAFSESSPTQLVVRKARCLIETGRIDEGRKLLASAPASVEGMEARAQLAILQETPEAGRHRWEELIARFPDRVEGFLGKVNLFLSRDAYDEAEALLWYVVVEWPDSIAARVLQAGAATAAKNWKVADERWAALVAAYPDRADVRPGYARHLAAHAGASSAQAYFATLVDQPVTLAQCLLEYHLARDDYGAAAQQARRLVELQAQEPLHRLRQAWILMRHGAGDSLHAALWILRDLQRHSPDSIIIKTLLAEGYIRAGKTRDATQIIESFPDDEKRVEVEVLRAWRSHVDGDDTAAKQHWGGILDRQYTPALHAPIKHFRRIDASGATVRAGEIVLVSAFRNEAPRTRWFLDYYRRLGVDKFVIVDNGSTDNTVNLLKGRADVILYETSDAYSRSGSGMRWINELIDRHGQANWCLHVDADEALIFPGYEHSTLHDLTERLASDSSEAMLAPMIDMYPQTPVSEIGNSAERMQESYNFFDNDLWSQGYSICPYREIYGGVRRRLFEGYQLLNKVPLINGAAGVRFLLSSHRTTPAKLGRVTGALLHYHLFYILQPEHREKLDEAIDHRQFPSNSLERLRSRDLLPVIARAGSLLGPNSVALQSSAQLGRLGILNDG
jgi:thioredoxin-like negative regulator of GroEL